MECRGKGKAGPLCRFIGGECLVLFLLLFSVVPVLAALGMGEKSSG